MSDLARIADALWRAARRYDNPGQVVLGGVTAGQIKILCGYAADQWRKENPGEEPMKDLKPCPFCGGEAMRHEADQNYFPRAICTKCGCALEVTKDTKDPGVIWNIRIEPPAAEPPPPTPTPWLIRLPSGAWIHVATVSSISPHDRSDDYPSIQERVHVQLFDGNRVVVNFGSMKEAQAYADELGERVQKGAWAWVAAKVKGEASGKEGE